MNTVVDITSIFGRTGLRGLKKCPKCHTFAGNRATFCKRKGCDTSFNKNFEKKSTTSASKIYSSAGKLIYSVRLRNNGPDYRGFVEFKQSNNSFEDLSTLDKINVKCYILSCKLTETDGAPADRPTSTCEHIKSALDCFTVAAALEIHDNILETLQMPKSIKAKIRELPAKYPTQPIVQRVSKRVMVVKTEKPKKAIFKKKKKSKRKVMDNDGQCNFVHTFFHNDKSSDEKRYICSCTKRRKQRNYKKDKLNSNKNEIHDDIIQKHCWHYYACIAAFASNTELSNEFSKYIPLSNLAYEDISQDSAVNNYFSLCPSNNGIFVELSDNLLLKDNLLNSTENHVIRLADNSASVIELQSDLNLQPNNSIDWSFTCSDRDTQEMVSNFNFVVSNSNLSMSDENVNNENETQTCYEVTEIDLNEDAAVLPISDASILSGLESSPIKILDIQVDKIGNNTALYNGNDNIKIITMDECNQLSDKVDLITDNQISIESSNVVISNDIIDEIYNDKSIFLNGNVLSGKNNFQRKSAVKNVSKSVNSKHNNKRNFNTSSENVVIGENVLVGNSSINNSVASSEPSLEFIHWLSSVTEMMNHSMHYKALEKNEPLSFHVNQKLFDCFCERLSYGSSKKRMPNETARFNLDRSPFGTFTKFTWIISNVFHLKQIFETPLITLNLTRRFIQKEDGAFIDIKDDKTMQSVKPNVSAKKSKRLSKKTEIVMYLKVGHTEENQEKATPFFIEWIPDILPITKTGELRLVFEFGFRKRNIYFD